MGPDFSFLGSTRFQREAQEAIARERAADGGAQGALTAMYRNRSPKIALLDKIAATMGNEYERGRLQAMMLKARQDSSGRNFELRREQVGLGNRDSRIGNAFSALGAAATAHAANQDKQRAIADAAETRDWMRRMYPGGV